MHLKEVKSGTSLIHSNELLMKCALQLYPEEM